MDSVRLKWMASDLGIEKLVLKKGSFIGYFIADQQSDFYQTERFGKILRYLQSQSRKGTSERKANPERLAIIDHCPGYPFGAGGPRYYAAAGAGTEVPSV